MVKEFINMLKHLFSFFDPGNEIPLGDYVYVNSVIEMLSTEPEKWKARWFADDIRICKSIRCGDILVMYETGAIIHPFYPAMTRAQKRSLSRLAREILKR